jgi:hypothetical protein
VTYAVICKTVDAEGVVSYTELPADECRSPVSLPESSRYAPRPIPQRSPKANATATDREESFSGYKAMTIVKPQSGAEIHSDQGKVPVAIALDPDLQPGHRINVFLDGALIPGRFDGLALELNGVDSGSHDVQVVVTDGGGGRLIDSAAVNFRLFKTVQPEKKADPIPSPAAE